MSRTPTPGQPTTDQPDSRDSPDSPDSPDSHEHAHESLAPHEPHEPHERAASMEQHGPMEALDGKTRDELVAEVLRLRAAQVELGALGERYLELFESAPMPYLVLDERGIIRELNREVAHLFGEEMHDLRGRSLGRFMNPKERRAFMDHVRAISDSKSARTAPLTVSLHLRAGNTAVVRLTSRALSKGSMPFAGVRTVLLDVSREERADDELRLAVRMREDFLAVVAHDLRSPLAAIVMSAELLERQAATEETGPRKQRELDRIRRATTRMNRLVADLLDLSSMDAGHLAMEPAMENVESLIVAALEIASPLAARKNISLSAHVDGGFVEAWCDRERVIQVLLNLITNAVKFTASGSISVRAKRDAGGVHFAVHDTGKGMSRAQLDHVFDPYWQVSPTTRDGTGLGLSIVKGIVQLHGGRVWAESRPGRGSSFSFTLPRDAPGTAPADLESSAPLPRPSSLPTSLSSSLPSPEHDAANAAVHRHAEENVRDARGRQAGRLVMLIDDEISVRDSVTEALRGEGYEVVAVPHGRAALDYLDRASVMPSLILLDLVMPVMDGWEFLRQHSRAPRLAAVPVVLISAQAEQQEMQQRQRHAQHAQHDPGADDAVDQRNDPPQGIDESERGVALAGFIQKPVRLARLCEVVESSCAA
jgi:PAS domain S-box-containing protein